MSSGHIFGGQVISGAHVIVYSKDAEADRAFFRDVRGFKSVDAGHGWLIFDLPPGEAAFHPSDENGQSRPLLFRDARTQTRLSLRRPLGFDRGRDGTHHRASPSVLGIPGRPKGVNGNRAAIEGVRSVMLAAR